MGIFRIKDISQYRNVFKDEKIIFSMENLERTVEEEKLDVGFLDKSLTDRESSYQGLRKIEEGVYKGPTGCKYWI